MAVMHDSDNGRPGGIWDRWVWRWQRDLATVISDGGNALYLHGSNITGRTKALAGAVGLSTAETRRAHYGRQRGVEETRRRWSHRSPKEALFRRELFLAPHSAARSNPKNGPFNLLVVLRERCCYGGVSDRSMRGTGFVRQGASDFPPHRIPLSSQYLGFHSCTWATEDITALPRPLPLHHLVPVPSSDILCVPFLGSTSSQ